MTIYSFGISLNRPVVLVCSLILPDKKEEEDPSSNLKELEESQAWRYFIAIPLVFQVFCILGTIFVVKYDSPMYLVREKRFSEAK